MSLLADEYHDLFGAWLDAGLPNPLPERVAAFVLVLYEGRRTFDAQIAGTAAFDATDSAWAHDLLFSNGESLFSVTRRAVSGSWQAALRLYYDLVDDYLRTGSPRDALNAAQAVAVTFADGRRAFDAAESAPAHGRANGVAQLGGAVGGAERAGRAALEEQRSALVENRRPLRLPGPVPVRQPQASVSGGSLCCRARSNSTSSARCPAGTARCRGGKRRRSRTRRRCAARRTTCSCSSPASRRGGARGHRRIR
jgi:hypothetical protein